MLPKDIHNERILYLVLDWGLGHASRSIPLIKQLIKQNNKLTLASSGSALLFLKAHFPNLDLRDMKQKEVNYSNRVPVWIKLLFQFKKIKSLVDEQLISDIYQSTQSTALISDNVYVSSQEMNLLALVTHQLSIPSPFGFMLPLPASWLKPWKAIWIPDDERLKLSGKLAKHPQVKGNYIGFLSNWDKGTFQQDGQSLSKGMICTGPEAHKKSMETMASKYDVNWVANAADEKKANGIAYYPALSSQDLQEKVEGSNTLVIRGGYSTLMDLVHVGYQGTLHFYPHQGQLEQKYLQKRWASAVFQKSLKEYLKHQ